MITQKGFFKDSIFLYKWLPEGKTKAVVQLIHGMAEHAARYRRLAEFLTQNGIAVYADDHRGHGLSVKDELSWGVVAERDGFSKMLEDEKDITDEIRSAFPNLPIILLGHSMGSFIGRCYAAKYGASIGGLILSGTGDPSRLELLGGLLIAGFQVKIVGRKSPAHLLDRMSFGAYNQAFAPNRTSFDWLTSDEAEVDQYLKDPFCGNIFPTGFYLDLFQTLLSLKSSKSFRGIPKDLPICLISGEKDPVGGFGKGVKSVFERYKHHGFSRVEMKLFPGGRHEMLNEVHRMEVMQLLKDWVTKLPSKPFVT